MKRIIMKTFLMIASTLMIFLIIPSFYLNCSAFFVVENGIEFTNYNDKVYASGVTDETITDLVIPEYVQERKVEGVLGISNFFV